jgi:hypothetical protein
LDQESGGGSCERHDQWRGDPHHIPVPRDLRVVIALLGGSLEARPIRGGGAQPDLDPLIRPLIEARDLRRG